MITARELGNLLRFSENANMRVVDLALILYGVAADTPIEQSSDLDAVVSRHVPVPEVEKVVEVKAPAAPRKPAAKKKK